MKTAAVLAAMAMGSAAMAGVTFNDSQNELFDNGFAHLDIASVTVDHDANNVYFSLTVRGDVDNPTWGKYCIGINAPGGVNVSGNGWGRNVNWNGQGIDYWIGTWADDGGSGFGGEVRQMNADNSNNLLAATYLGSAGFSGTAVGNTVTWSIARSMIGMSSDGTFTFDLITTGGGNDPGVDHLSRSDSSTSAWGETSVSGNFLSYSIPAPSALALLGLGGIAAGRRRR